MSAERLPDLEMEVIGFRQWRVDDHLRLCAAYIPGVTWEPGENVAHCHRNVLQKMSPWPVPATDAGWDHVTPHPDCECGLYALHAPDFWYGDEAHDSIRSMMRRLGGVDHGVEYVSGLVSGWGRLEVHRKGFRAERARVVAIAIPSGKRAALVARAVAAEYGVPTVPRAELERVAGEFGDRVPAHLLPERPRPSVEVRYRVPIGLASTYAGLAAQMEAAILKAAKASPPVLPPTSHVEVFHTSPKPRRTRDQFIKDLLAPSYDPAAFTPKRKGGKR